MTMPDARGSSAAGESVPASPTRDVDPVRAGVYALSWPALFLALGAITALVWSCSAAVGCLARSAASSVPVAVAGPTVAALYSTGARGTVLFVVGALSSVAIWAGLGWLLAKYVQRRGGGWNTWWKLYLSLAAAWTVLLLGMMGLATLKLLG